MLEKLGFLDLITEALRVERPAKALTMPQFILAMIVVLGNLIVSEV
ncbi:MAG: hypothetical protein ACKV2U_05015 [Bryobacteraceae bacterium]